MAESSERKTVSIEPVTNTPYKGKLVNLLTTGDANVALREEARKLPALELTPRQVCDLELLLNGGFSPLTGFLNEEDYLGFVAVFF